MQLWSCQQQFQEATVGEEALPQPPTAVGEESSLHNIYQQISFILPAVMDIIV